MVKKIMIVSLSRGIIGESFVKHEVDLGLQRLRDLGIEVCFSKHALMGLDYINAHPEARAEDLLEAFRSDADMILCAVGGEDTYRLLPYLFDHGELKSAVSKKIFLGFSDSTVNHFMLKKAGLDTFYGQAFLPDVCDIGADMLPYTRQYFEELLRTGTIREIRPAEVWYECRNDFSVEAMGTSTPEHENQGFRSLQGPEEFTGEIFGGCIDTIYDMFDNGRFADTVELCEKYGLFPDNDFWKGKILLLESSEEQAEPEKYRKMLLKLRERGVFSEVSGVITGKPADEKYFAEYKEILREVIDDPALPVVTNVNVGHALPRCIIPFGVKARVSVKEQVIRFYE